MNLVCLVWALLGSIAFWKKAVYGYSVLDQSDSLDDVWELYKTTHNKQYSSSEEYIRRSNWNQNVEIIDKHNLEHDMDMHSYRMGINQYTDWTFEEYKTTLLGLHASSVSDDVSSRLLFRPRFELELPKEIDWRTLGAVTPVKDQGRCGSCWAFSSTGSLEGQHFKKTGKLVSLSEQNLMDCDTDNHGCNGGWMDNSFDYVETNGGIDTENSYPYEGKDDVCRYNKTSSGSTCKGHVDITVGDEHALKEAVANVGPVSVGIDAAHPGFMHYRSGIFYDSSCSHSAADHGVLVVGYGQENGYDYWLVKNSWNTTWGDAGYLKMARNVDNMCAIASHASYPLV